MILPRTPKGLNIRVRDNRRVEFFMLPDDLIDVHAALLDSPSAVLVYVALCRFARSAVDTQIAYTTLAARLSLSRPTLSKALALLEQRGYITVDRAYGQKGAETNIYTIERLPVSPENELTGQSRNWTDRPISDSSATALLTTQSRQSSLRVGSSLRRSAGHK